MNKKAIFTPLFVIFTFILLTIVSLYLLNTKASDINRNLGASQLETINTYQQAEEQLFYIEQIAKISQDQAIDEFMKNGGVYNLDNCQMHQGYVIWDANTNCIPEIQDNFLKIFLINLNRNLPKELNLNYELSEISIVDDSILAQTEKELTISKKINQTNITYSIPFNFKIPLKINLNSYETLKNNIFSNRACIKDSINRISLQSAVSDCINLKNFNIYSSASTLNQVDIMKFDINNNEVISVKDQIKNPNLSFIIKLS